MIRRSKASIMALIRTSSGVSVTRVLVVFGYRADALDDVWGVAREIFAWALACWRPLRVAAHDLLHADGNEAVRDADQGQREKGQPSSFIQTGKKPVQAIGMFAGFGGYNFIAHQQVHVPGR